MANPRSVTVTSSSDPDRRAQTRQHILNATERLLAGGEAFAKLSIQRIAVAAGVSRATFYLHFHTKRELIAALAQDITAAWTEIAAPFLTDPLASRDDLEQGLHRILVLWRQHRAVVAAIIELAEYDLDMRQAWRDTLAGIAQIIGQSLQQRRSQLPPEKTELLSWFIVWSGERFMHQEVGEASPERDHLLVAVLSEIVWKLMHD